MLERVSFLVILPRCVLSAVVAGGIVPPPTPMQCPAAGRRYVLGTDPHATYTQTAQDAAGGPHPENALHFQQQTMVNSFPDMTRTLFLGAREMDDSISALPLSCSPLYPLVHVGELEFQPSKEDGKRSFRAGINIVGSHRAKLRSTFCFLNGNRVETKRLTWGPLGHRAAISLASVIQLRLHASVTSVISATTSIKLPINRCLIHFFLSASKIA